MNLKLCSRGSFKRNLPLIFKIIEDGRNLTTQNLYRYSNSRNYVIKEKDLNSTRCSDIC